VTRVVDVAVEAVETISVRLPRRPLRVQCVGASAPGEPPPLIWRTALSSFASHLPIAPPRSDHTRKTSS
jgi:hypothetical protein